MTTARSSTPDRYQSPARSVISGLLLFVGALCDFETFQLFGALVDVGSLTASRHANCLRSTSLFGTLMLFGSHCHAARFSTRGDSHFGALIRIGALLGERHALPHCFRYQHRRAHRARITRYPQARWQTSDRYLRTARTLNSDRLTMAARCALRVDLPIGTSRLVVVAASSSRPPPPSTTASPPGPSPPGRRYHGYDNAQQTT